MRVRELIESLLDYEMDHEVVVKNNFNDDYEEIDFEIDDNYKLKEIYLNVDMKDYELIDKKRLEELEDIELDYKDLMNNQ